MEKQLEIIYTQNSENLAKKLGDKLSLPCFLVNTKKFNNGEICVLLPKRFDDVIVVSSTVTNNDWIELFLLLNALRDAHKIYLCLPFMGYTRQDHCTANRSYGARMFSQILDNMNIAICFLIDNHTEPMMRTITHHVSAQNIFAQSIASKKYNTKQIVIVSPDIGGAYRAESLSRVLKCDFALCTKVRNFSGDLAKTNLIGDVKNKICILVDDMIDSGATLCHASAVLLDCGCCREMIAYVTHCVLSEGCAEQLERSGIAEIFVTDTISRRNKFPKKIIELSVASLLAEAIQCTIVKD